MPSEERGIVVHAAARSFGAVQAVRDISFEARAGEVTALVGPNGSGKTTLLLMLATLLVPDHGSLRINGLDPIAAPHAVRRVTGWMPDVLGSWPNLTVTEALALTGRLYGMSPGASRARAEELISLVRLDPLARRRTRVLSRGQKQLLSLARALVHDPDVLLLDEPASGLDPGARVALRSLLRNLAAQGRTVLVSSHVLSELEEFSDAAVFIEAGTTVSAERVAAARVGRREWRIFSPSPDRLRQVLASLALPPGSSREANGSFYIVIEGGENAAAALLERLVAGGAPVAVFAPAVGELEHTFLDLQQGGR